MNEGKICFITCVNDEIKYQKMLGYLANLEVPAGFETEVVTMKEINGMAVGYNQGMRSSDAKYKVYVTQDTLITNRCFIRDVIRIFSKDNTIGMIGVLGNEVIPTSAICQKAQKRMGRIQDINTGKILSWKNPEDLYEKVQAIDGFLMITQYDISWREDIFTGEHFYDLAQSVEFARKDYQVVVARQDEPWCITNYSNLKNDSYEKDRNLFLDEYSKDVYPLVSILIPTYNRPAYFKFALESAINQTYRNIEIIIGDGSKDNQTEDLIQPYLKNRRIKYFRDSSDINVARWRKLENDAEGEYISWLLDDDIIHKDKISVMVSYYLEYENIVLVTSHRQIIDAAGNECRDIKATLPICKTTSIFSGEEIGKNILIGMLNFVGELSTVLLKKEFLTNGKRANYFKNVENEYNWRYIALGDIITWLDVLHKGNVVYICDTLNYFRLHGGQSQNALFVQVLGLIDWFRLMNDSYKAKLYLTNEEDLYNALNVWLKNTASCKLNIGPDNVREFEHVNVLKKYIKEAEEKFVVYNSRG